MIRVRLAWTPAELAEVACLGCGKPQLVPGLCRPCLIRHERETGDAAAREYLGEVARAS